MSWSYSGQICRSRLWVITVEVQRPRRKMYTVVNMIGATPTGRVRLMWCSWYYTTTKKLSHTRLPSVGFRSWSRFLAVSLQVTWVIIPAVGCHYFQPGLHWPPQPLRGLLPILLLGEQRHNGCLPKTVTRQRRDCDLSPGPSAPESSTLTTRLLSHYATTRPV